VPYVFRRISGTVIKFGGGGVRGRLRDVRRDMLIPADTSHQMGSRMP